MHTHRCKHFSDSDQYENNVTVVGFKPLQCLSVLVLIMAFNYGLGQNVSTVVEAISSTHLSLKEFYNFKDAIQ